MKIYTRGMTDAVYIQPKLAILFVIIGLLDHFRTPGDKLISAAGHFKQTQWRSLFEAIINLSASIGFTFFLGFTGVLLGSLCSYIYRTFDIIYYSAKHILRVSVKKTFLKIVINLITFLFLFFFTLHMHIQIDTVLQWILYAVGFGISYGIIFLFLVVIQLKTKYVQKLLRGSKL